MKTLVTALGLGSMRPVSHWLSVVQSELSDLLYHTPIVHDPGVCPIIHHGTNFDFDVVTTKMFCDQYFQHATNFGVIVYKSSRVSFFFILRVLVIPTRAYV